MLWAGALILKQNIWTSCFISKCYPGMAYPIGMLRRRNNNWTGHSSLEFPFTRNTQKRGQKGFTWASRPSFLSSKQQKGCILVCSVMGSTRWILLLSSWSSHRSWREVSKILGVKYKKVHNNYLRHIIQVTLFKKNQADIWVFY